METISKQPPIESRTSEPVPGTVVGPTKPFEIEQPVPDPQHTQPVEAGQPPRRGFGQRIGRAAAARAATEVIGIGVDAALMGAGGAGVALLENVGARETVATGVDLALLNKLNPHEQNGKLPPSKLRRLGHMAVVMAAAVVAQKIGPGVAEHISGSLGHGLVGHFAIPLTSKVGATTGIQSILKRTA